MNNILAGFIGALIAIMTFFNSILAGEYGNYVSSIIIHSVGLVIIIVILMVRRERIQVKKGIPIYFYSAGAIGVITVLFNNIVFLELGASLSIALGLLGQSIASLLIDHFGLFNVQINRINNKKLIGIFIIFIGIIIMAEF